MKERGKALGLLAVMALVVAYTMYNYSVGKITPSMFLVSMVIMGIPMLNIVNILIQQWKNKD